MAVNELKENLKKMSHAPINQFELLSKRRFLPLFLTQFLGAFNDNAFKNAVAVLITYRLAVQTGINSGVLVTLATALFVLPFLLFSAIAGQLSDKYEKSRLICLIKFSEVFIMLIAIIGLFTSSVMNSVFLLMLVLFLLGVQMAFFGPLKYAILPDHLHEDELVSGNALIEAGTFIAILIGSILGGSVILNYAGILTISILILGVALTGWASSFFIPKAEAPAKDLQIRYNIFSQTWEILRYSAQSESVFLCILGISWFWLVGATFLTQLPVFTKDVIGAEQGTYTLFLTIFSVGIAIGSMLCNRLLKGKVHATYVPLAALGMTLFMVDLFYTSQFIVPHNTASLMPITQFLMTAYGWHIATDLLLISVCGGIYTVPLYALLQVRSEKNHRARTIASNNVMNALFMVLATMFAMGMFALHFSVTQVFLVIAIANGLVALYICKLLPAILLKSLIRGIFKILYRAEINGLENFSRAGDFVLVVANHTSFLDAALIAVFLPEKITFAINTLIAQKWWIKPILKLVEVHTIDPANPMAVKKMIALIRSGKKCVAFPEGRITVTGSLMKIYEGPGMIAEKSGAQILPLRIDGAQYTYFSRLKGKVRIHPFPKITLTVLEPYTLTTPVGMKGRARRHYNGLKLYDVMSEMLFKSTKQQLTLFQSLLDARKIHGRSHLVVEDIERKPINYQQFLTRTLILGRTMTQDTIAGEYVGVLLPSMISTTVVFFGLQAFSRVPAMLNFSTGIQNVLLACQIAGIKTVYSTQKFVKTARLEEMVAALTEVGIHIIYLEALREKISFFDRLKGMLVAQFPHFYYRQVNRCNWSAIASVKQRGFFAYHWDLWRNGEISVELAQKPTVLLFTSGSEGTPKGVLLSHLNIQANCAQLRSRIDFGPTDKIFNSLPLFHSFGLTGGTLLPLLSGVRIFFYPSPLHYRMVPELIYDTNATILFSTDTFLAAYAKYGHPYDFYSVRYVFAGAEKLKESTRAIWAEELGVRIFEGYGATETAPILSVNTPMHHKGGTVGRLMPGIHYKLEPVPGIETGGKLIVSGPNIMLGYLRNDVPGTLIAPPDGRYDTGDVVTVDAEGYITICGRVKRFAKVGGEMISLLAVENYLTALWPDNLHAVIAIPDEKKGEQLVLVTDYQDAKREAIVVYARMQGISEISIPRQIKVMEQLPLLATGKVDYVKIGVCLEV